MTTPTMKITRTNETFRSVTGDTVNCVFWVPDGEIRGVLQVVHGMAEHINRYDATARALCAAGYAVVGHTHVGHGEGARLPGWFAESDGWQCLINDVHALRGIAQARFPGAPYFLLGHSMGSFVVRCYIMQYAQGLSGAVLTGTGYHDAATALLGHTIARAVCLFGGAKKPSKLLDSMAFSANNKPFEPARTPCDWLSRDAEQVDRYVADPLCGFMFTGAGFRDMFEGLRMLADRARLKTIPKELPILLMSGENDPVGSMGKGVKKVEAMLRQAGLKDVRVKLYEGARHEIFNETNHEEVENDLVSWLEEKCV